MIIDFHTHIFPPHIKKNRKEYVENDPCFAVLYSDSKAKMATAEELIQSMDKAGIEKSVVCNIGWTMHDYCVETNDYIIESVNKYPDRLIGFCSVQPLAEEAALNEIQRCAEAGIKGIGEMRPDVQLFNLMDTQMTEPFAELLQKNNMMLMLHCSEPVGHEYPGKGSVTPDFVYSFIKEYPKLKIICAHWGGGLPFYALMPEVKKALKNTWFDSAATEYLYEGAVYETTASLVGEDKILFGTDFPLIEQKKALKGLESLSLESSFFEKVTSKNALELLNL